MRVIEARNVHQAFPKGLRLLEQYGVERASRNGPVKVAPWPVTTVYARPYERVLFWAERDANPAFHLYEALWMLAGRDDVAPLTRYVKDFGRFSDDGVTLHGAYGHRWKRPKDQLAIIADRLTDDPNDRRCVLQMWDVERDLGRVGKDAPCNTTAVFQCDADGRLDLTVFCRSNDIVWGAYGANAVHFGFLLEYMALWIGCPIGTYRQVSVNWHSYVDVFEQNIKILGSAFKGMYAEPTPIPDPYVDRRVRSIPLLEQRYAEAPHEIITRVDTMIAELLVHAETEFAFPRIAADEAPFFDVAHAVLRAHHAWRTLAAPERYEEALRILSAADPQADWIVAATDWTLRRQKRWRDKMENEPAIRR